MSKPDAWMPTYWADLFVDTAAFGAERFGAYAALLGHAWLNGGSLLDDDDELARLAKCTPEQWITHRPRLSQPPYFVVRNGRWYQKRLTEEWEKASTNYEAAVDNGRRGGRPPKPNETGTKPGGLAEPNPVPNPNQTQPTTHNSHSSPKGEEQGALPDWLPADLWRDFKQHRTKLRASMTPRAERLMVKELAQLRAAGHDPVAVLEESIRCGWKGVFAPKAPARGNVSRLTPAGQRTAENLSAWLNDSEEKGNGTDGP